MVPVADRFSLGQKLSLSRLRSGWRPDEGNRRKNGRTDGRRKNKSMNVGFFGDVKKLMFRARDREGGGRRVGAETVRRFGKKNERINE